MVWVPASGAVMMRATIMTIKKPAKIIGTSWDLRVCGTVLRLLQFEEEKRAGMEERKLTSFLMQHVFFRIGFGGLLEEVLERPACCSSQARSATFQITVLHDEDAIPQLVDGVRMCVEMSRWCWRRRVP